jgi:serine/threonine-protein phosphatase 2A regulatory subunit B'
MQHEQLSRSKDPNKSSKSKNKEHKDGASSPSQPGSSRDAAHSPIVTPSASTTSLNDPRNKPLPPNDGGAANSGHTVSPPPQQPSSLSTLNTNQHGLPVADRFNSMGATSPSGGGQGTPNRHQILPPSVIISPSAPVCSKNPKRYMWL